jgi:hypothetical protein
LQNSRRTRPGGRAGGIRPHAPRCRDCAAARTGG